MEWDFSGNPAKNYERHLVPAIFVPLAEDLIKVANIQPDEHVLDVACGTGIISRLILVFYQLRLGSEVAFD